MKFLSLTATLGTVLLAGTVRGEGSGRTKKAAEQEAAEVAWRALSAEA